MEGMPKRANPFEGAPGLPSGGQMPTPDQMQGTQNSPLLAGLMQQLGQGQGQPLDGIGTGDPQMGLEQILAMLGLSSAGVGGGPPDMGGEPPGGSGVPQLPTRPGMAIGAGGGAY